MRRSNLARAAHAAITTIHPITKLATAMLAMLATLAMLPTLATLATLATACGSDPTSAPPDAARAASPDASSLADAASSPIPDGGASIHPDATPGSSLTLTIPASYAGAPRELAVVATKTVPVAGPPDAVLLLDNAPVVSAGASLPLSLDTSALSGDLYIVAVLYQQGGGQLAPKSGVDYVAQSAAPHHFAGAPVDLGTLALELAP